MHNCMSFKTRELPLLFIGAVGIATAIFGENWFWRLAGIGTAGSALALVYSLPRKVDSSNFVSMSYDGRDEDTGEHFGDKSL